MRIATQGTFFCPGCLAPSDRGLPCTACVRSAPIAALWVACPLRQPILRQAIEALKYDGVTELAEPLSEILARYLLHLRNSGILLPDFDGIVPVPLHRRKYLFRGFNQAGLLAAAIHRRFGWPLMEGAVIRSRATAAQVGRSRRSRLRNVANAFVAPAPLTGRRLLLLDDVVTTGSTLRACAKALQEAGAASVTALVLAHG